MHNTHFISGMRQRSNAGFTMIEILVAILIGILITMSAFYAFSSLRNNDSLEKNVLQAKSILEEARSLSISEKSDSTYGVKILSDRLIRFRGSTYNAADSQNVTYLFDDSGATIDTISLSDAGSEIGFSKITGTARSYGTFRIKLTADSTKNATIRVTSTGIISQE